jgi:SNF2 family DNA or RNA helicase
MNVMEETKVVEPVPTPAEIIQAATALASVCDGAFSLDGMGYNGADSPTVKSILKFKNPTVRQIRALWNILRKYRKQLAGHGLNYDLLVPPPLPDPAPPRAPGAPAQPYVPAQLVIQLLWAGTDYGRRILVSSSYSPEVVSKIKKLEKRWFDKEGKNSAKIRNAWLIPDDVDAFDTLVGHLEEIEPAVKIEVAADLKAAMDAAREERRQAYAASRAESAELEIPTKLPLRPFQRAGVQWALDHDGRVLIGDDMGLGKTPEALGFLTVKGKDALPALVICPATLRGNWAREIGKFTGFTYQILTAKSSLKQLRKAGFVANTKPEPGYDITILNYDILEAETAATWLKMLHRSTDAKELAYAHENLVLCGLPAMGAIVKAMMKRPGLEIENRLNAVKTAIEALGDSARQKGKHIRSAVSGIPSEEFLKLGWKTMIMDEVHGIRESSSQRGMAANDLSKGVQYVLGLTGTPIVNRPKEAWHQVHCVDPKIFPSFFSYGKRYCNGHETRYGWDFSGASNLEELDRKLRTSIMIRRMKEQVLKELPPINRITVPMLLDEIGEYEDESKDPIKKLALLKKEREEWKAVLAGLSDEERKRYITEHAEQASKAQRISGLMLNEIEAVKQAAVKAKFNECVKYILDLQATQGKIIVFMSHHEFIDRMVGEMEKAGLKTGMIDGRVPMGKRDAIKDAFQEGDTQVLVAGIRAASEGLTLTASHTVVFVELDWNPSKHQQAQSRAHRFGQTSVTTVYYLVGLGTVEEEIARLIDSKAEVTAAATGSTDQTMTEQSIMEAVIEELLR